MAIPNVMADLSTTAATNSPAGSESPSNGDDFLRAIQAIVRTTNAKGADIASATTTDIGAATGEFVDVTGTTTITGLGTIAAGIVRTVRFTGALTLTHNATSLILPSSANILTAANDRATFRSLGSGNWICTFYEKASGRLLAGAYGSGLKGAALASAATTNIYTALDGDLVHITGTTAITSFGTAAAAGDRRTLVIDSAGVVITNGANLICPEGINIVSSAGDVITIVADTTTQHRVVSYARVGTTSFGGSFTRNLASASTTQVITGVGFRPKRVKFYMANPTAGNNAAFSVGEDNGTYATCIYDSTPLTATTNAVDTAVSIRGQASTGNQSGKISAFSNDGFTVSWTLTSTGPAFTATIFYVAEG
jgi:hypothetical protein